MFPIMAEMANAVVWRREKSVMTLREGKVPLTGFLSFSKIEMSKKRSPSWQNSTWKKMGMVRPVALFSRALAANEQSMGPRD